MSCSSRSHAVPTYETLIAFFLATAVFAYMPGPSTLYAAAQTIAGGQHAGWMAALGIHLGGYVHVVAAALGLAVVFTTVPLLYVALKFVGALYLIWIGVQMFLSPAATEIGARAVDVMSPRRAFWQSVTVEVFNPKTALFYLAFLPQFTDATAALPIWAQLLALGTVVNVMFSSADVLCVLLADSITRRLQSSGAATGIAKRIGGSILVALGIALATHQR